MPLALATWTLVHASGVHATVAGMALAFTVPVRPRDDEPDSRAERLEHGIRPLSAGVLRAGVRTDGLGGHAGRWWVWATPSATG